MTSSMHSFFEYRKPRVSDQVFKFGSETLGSQRWFRLVHTTSISKAYLVAPWVCTKCQI